MTMLYTPPDVDEASEAWGANCGPCALAAVLGRPVAAIRDAVSKPSRKTTQTALFKDEKPFSTYPGYMGIRDLRRAVVRAGASVGMEWSPVVLRALDFEESVLVMVEWAGPWTGTRGQAAYRHVIGYRRARGREEDALLLMSDEGRGKVLARLHADAVDLGRCDRWVFDANAGWMPLFLWERMTAPWLMPKRAAGWRFAWGGTVKDADG